VNSVRRFLTVFLACLGVVVTAVFISSGSAASPGSAEDPLVSKSYVDEQIKKALSGSSEELGEEQIEAIAKEVVSEMLANTDYSGNNGNAVVYKEAAAYVPVNVAAGSVVLGHEGTEMILRSGNAQAFVPGTDGIVNATTGAELQDGAFVEKNNVLIIPRFDGRGVLAESDCWLLIRGGYEFS